MDDPRPAALAEALRARHSRRRALRLLAGGAVGGALALGAYAVPEALALPALQAGWTHLAGTTTGLLCYKRGPVDGSGTGACGTFVDGRFTQKATLATFAPNWTHIVGAGRALFFYRASDGQATTAYLNAAGVWSFSGVEYLGRFARGCKRFAGSRGGRFAGYFDPDLQPDALTADGGLSESRRDRVAIDDGWTHFAGAGANAFLLYDRPDGLAVTGRIVMRPFHDVGELVWAQGNTLYFLPKGFTHVAGTFNGGLLFYNQATGKGISGYLDAATGAWSQTAANVNFGPGWTHAVGAGSRGLLFYNTNTGKAVGGFLDPVGTWTKTTTYG